MAAIPIKVIVQKPVVWHPFTSSQMPKPGVVEWTVEWGPVYPLTFDSDSGNVRDLNAVYQGEKLATQVEPTGYYASYDVPAKPGFSGRTLDRGGNDVNMQKRIEQAKTEADAIKAAATDIQKELDKVPTGTLALDQTFVFADARTETGTPLDPTQKGEEKGVIAPGKAWERGMRCNDYNSETFRWNPAGPNPAR